MFVVRRFARWCPRWGRIECKCTWPFCLRPARSIWPVDETKSPRSFWRQSAHEHLFRSITKHLSTYFELFQVRWLAEVENNISESLHVASGHQIEQSFQLLQKSPSCRILTIIHQGTSSNTYHSEFSSCLTAESKIIDFSEFTAKNGSKLLTQFVARIVIYLVSDADISSNELELPDYAWKVCCQFSYCKRFIVKIAGNFCIF